jgi:hypothetical protein
MQDNRDNTRARRAVGHSPLQIRVPKPILGTLDTAPCSRVLGEPWSASILFGWCGTNSAVEER